MPKKTEPLLKEMICNEKARSFRIFHDVIAIIIVLSVLALILESVVGIFAKYENLFFMVEVIFTGIFLAEYLARILFAKKASKYIFSTFGIIDLASFLPGLLIIISPAFAGFAGIRVLRILRIIRLLRLFRIMKVLKYTKKDKLVDSNIFKGLSSLDAQIYFFTLFSIITISGTLMYLIEGNLPNSQFSNIPLGMWWGVVTVSTVGYGDLIPVTVWGKILASLTMMMGLIMFAILITVIGKFAQIALFGTSAAESQKLREKINN